MNPTAASSPGQAASDSTLPELSSLSLKTQSEADPDNMADESTPIRSSCHCGAITVIVPRLPDHINHCQCTICRRYGAAWGYYHPDEVKIETKPNAVTKQYIWGDRDISFNFCDTCGCVLYWWPLQPPPTDGGEYQMGLNTSNVNPEVLRFVDRKYEYSWVKQPLRSKETAHQDDLAEY